MRASPEWAARDENEQEECRRHRRNRRAGRGRRLVSEPGQRCEGRGRQGPWRRPAADDRQCGGARAARRRRRAVCQRHRDPGTHRQPASANRHHHPQGPYPRRRVRQGRPADVLARRPRRPGQCRASRSAGGARYRNPVRPRAPVQTQPGTGGAELPGPERPRFPAQPGRGPARAGAVEPGRGARHARRCRAAWAPSMSTRARWCR